MQFVSLSPDIFVEEIEPCLGFWTDRLGFAKTAEVPEGDKLGFVMLQKDNVTVMYQSFASAEKDVAGLVERRTKPGTGLFITVEDFEAVQQAMEGADVIVPDRTTFYGAREIIVRAPCGTVVVFAKMTG